MWTQLTQAPHIPLQFGMLRTRALPAICGRTGVEHTAPWGGRASGCLRRAPVRVCCRQRAQPPEREQHTGRRTALLSVSVLGLMPDASELMGSTAPSQGARGWVLTTSPLDCVADEQVSGPKGYALRGCAGSCTECVGLVDDTLGTCASFVCANPNPNPRLVGGCCRFRHRAPRGWASDCGGACRFPARV